MIKPELIEFAGTACEFHKEFIQCPKCKDFQWGTVIHSRPFPSNYHQCKCGYFILESEWESTHHSMSVLMQQGSAAIFKDAQQVLLELMPMLSKAVDRSDLENALATALNHLEAIKIVVGSDSVSQMQKMDLEKREVLARLDNERS